MASGDSDVSIARRACLRVGVPAIESFDESSRPGEVLGECYWPLVREGLCSYHWHWASLWGKLTYLGESPSPLYRSRFKVPDQVIACRSIWNNDLRITDFDYNNREIFLDVNDDDAPIFEGVQEVSEDRWDPMFVEWVTLRLCAYLCGGVLRDGDRETKYLNEAHMKWRQAKFMAASTRTPRDMDTSVLIRFR